MREYTVQGPRHAGQIKRLDEQTRVSDLPAAAAAHEPPKLRLDGPSVPRRLFLESAERSKLTVSVNDLFHGGGTESPDQLVLQVRVAHVETECFHLGAREVRAEAGPLETALEVTLLGGVAETCQSDVQPLRAKPIEGASDGLRTPDRHDGDALSFEIPTSALGQCFERDLVADPFNEDDRTRIDAGVRRSVRAKSLLLLHSPIFTAHAEHARSIRTPLVGASR